MVGLERRAEFLAAAKGRRVHMPAFVLQAVARPERPERVGIGLTVTKKLGGAVVRNRIRRRLRAAVRAAADVLDVGGVDLVIVAREAALTCPFEELVRSLREAFASPAVRRCRPPAPAARSSVPSRAPSASASGPTA
ncbi:MAG: ribonuclease P protein component [Geminicoccaceae bacterium]|nr:ribonuclease P protein component [Geminicoccaceae bacterium]MCX8102378.1 ribonuclease P protein component [Geminicoccaceae bacterium]